MTYDPQRGCGEQQKWHGNLLWGKKRSNSQCWTIAIVMPLKSYYVDDKRCRYSNISHLGENWGHWHGLAMAVYLFGFILNHSFQHLMKGQRFGAFFCDQKLELKQMCSSTLEARINKRAPARLRSPISLTSFFLRQRQQTELLLKELATCTWGRVHISALCHTGDWHDNCADSVKHTGYWEFWPVW